MLCLDFVGGRLYPNPRLRVFVTDSLKVILERFWNFVSGLVNFLGFFFCQFFVCDWCFLTFDGRCGWGFIDEGCPLLFGLSRSESMVISSVSLILGEVIGRFLFLVDVVVRGDVSMFSILADWLICRLGIVLVGVVWFSKKSGFAAVGLGFV